jgi:hypothetical protein
MTSKKSLIQAAAVLIAAAAPVLSHASDIPASCPQVFGDGQCIFGAATQAKADRVVDTAKTRFLAVDYGETVKFVHAGQEFTWTFNGLDARAVQLASLTGGKLGGNDVMVYVRPNPLTRS